MLFGHLLGRVNAMTRQPIEWPLLIASINTTRVMRGAIIVDFADADTDIDEMVAAIILMGAGMSGW